MKSNNNRKINQIAGIILGIAIMLNSSSCSEEFLKPNPLSFFEPAATFTTLSGLEATMAMCDRHLRSYYSYYEGVDRSLPISTELAFSDVAVFGMTDNAEMLLDIANALTPTNDIRNGDGNRIRYFWDETYNGIKYANTIISYIDGVDGLDETTKNMFLGRAYFHRSFRYFALVFQFNDVPLVSKINEVPKQNYRSTKREAILDMITQDMEFAVQWVPEQSEMSLMGMVSKGACRMLLIKCYLATGQYAKALEQANILINGTEYSLMRSTFGTFVNPMPTTWPITRNVIWDLHRPDNKNIAANSEVILGLPNRHGLSSSITMRTMRNWLPMLDVGSTWLLSPSGRVAIRMFARSNAAQYDNQLDYNIAHGRGIAHIRPTRYTTNDILYLNGVYDAGDLRHRSDVGNWVRMTDLKYNNPDDPDWYGQPLRKWDDDGNLLCTDSIRSWFDWHHYKMYVPNPDDLSNLNNTGQQGGAGDWYLYRLAEAYLLRAEAKFYLGQIDGPNGATADVNAVRERAECTEFYATVTIGDIMDERARELYLEEWRHMELVRISYCLAQSGKTCEFGKTYTVANLHENSYWWERVSAHNDYYNKGVVNPRLSNRPYTIARKNIYWPIPQFAIDDNIYGQLRQNPEYAGYNASVPMWETWQEAVADEDKID